MTQNDSSDFNKIILHPGQMQNVWALNHFWCTG